MVLGGPAGMIPTASNDATIGVLPGVAIALDHDEERPVEDAPPATATLDGRIEACLLPVRGVLWGRGGLGLTRTRSRFTCFRRVCCWAYLHVDF